MMKGSTKYNTKPDKVQSPDPLLDSSRQWPTLVFDVELYQHHLDNADLTQEQKDAFLLDLWKCIVGFVDLGFGVHPLQQAISDGCEQNQDLIDFFRLESEDMVECDNNPKTDFRGIADEQSGASPERNQK